MLNKKFFFKFSKKFHIVIPHKNKGSFGRISVFSKGSLNYKNKLRILDDKRLLCLEGILVSLEKYKSRSGFIGCICYTLGYVSFMVVPYELKLLGQ